MNCKSSYIQRIMTYYLSKRMCNISTIIKCTVASMFKAITKLEIKWSFNDFMIPNVYVKILKISKLFPVLTTTFQNCEASLPFWKLVSIEYQLHLKESKHIVFKLSCSHACPQNVSSVHTVDWFSFIQYNKGHIKVTLVNYFSHSLRFQRSLCKMQKLLKQCNLSSFLFYEHIWKISCIPCLKHSCFDNDLTAVLMRI